MKRRNFLLTPLLAALWPLRKFLKLPKPDDEPFDTKNCVYTSRWRLSGATLQRYLAWRKYIRSPRFYRDLYEDIRFGSPTGKC